MGAYYRIGQLWQALTAAPLGAAAWRDVGTILSPAEQALFRRFTANDQQHSYRVMQTLRAAGHGDRSLLKAALLHDVGKTRFNVTLLDRSAAVLVKACVPHKVSLWGDVDPAGAHWWQRPFIVLRQHPAWGAEMVQTAGSDPRTIALIRRHQDDLKTISCEEDQLLSYLQWADNQN